MKCRCSNCGWLEVNPNGAMFCGYSDKRTWEDESCLAWKDKDEPQTNADHIRSMTDEELAEYIRVFYPEVCPPGKCPGEDYCYKCWLDWLKSPVEEVDNG